MKIIHRFLRPRFIASLVVVILIFSHIPGFAAGNGTFDVLDYGAIGDGTNNDTTAIQKTVDACAANGGGEVVLPGGRTFYLERSCYVATLIFVSCAARC